MTDSTRVPTLQQVIELHDQVLRAHGGADGIRDRGGLESAVAQPSMTFGGDDLYPTLAEKAAALCFSLAKNHAFIDGNKRTAWVAARALLQLNGRALIVSADEGERVMVAVASGGMGRDELAAWIDTTAASA